MTKFEVVWVGLFRGIQYANTQIYAMIWYPIFPSISFHSVLGSSTFSTFIQGCGRQISDGNFLCFPAPCVKSKAWIPEGFGLSYTFPEGIIAIHQNFKGWLLTNSTRKGDTFIFKQVKATSTPFQAIYVCFWAFPRAFAWIGTLIKQKLFPGDKNDFWEFQGLTTAWFQGFSYFQQQAFYPNVWRNKWKK